MYLTRVVGLLAVTLFSAKTLAQECESYGIDFQNGGSYFQNISSSADFTFVSLFEGCQNDTASNILVDPNGDEYQCTDTPLLPDDTPELSTCPLEKSEMFSGDWSVLIISNNGDDDPIAYERDFYLSVGVPVTTTFTPVVTLSVTTTPIVNVTSTQITTNTITSSVTVTSPSKTLSPTTTVTPKKTTVTVTKTMGTVRKTKYTATVDLITKIHTATCSIPPVQPTRDPTCSITPTLVTAAALSTSGSKLRFDRRVPLDRAERIAERKARLDAAAPLKKRAPDSATVTVTDTNTADWATTTTTSTAAASTLSITSISTLFTTTTTTSTVYSGVSTRAQVTVTAPTPTVTQTRYTITTTTVATVTRTQSITITQTSVPAASSTICKAKGGRMV